MKITYLVNYVIRHSYVLDLLRHISHWAEYSNRGLMFNSYQEKCYEHYGAWTVVIYLTIFMIEPKLFPVLLSYNIICRSEDVPLFSTHQSLHIHSSLLFPDTTALSFFLRKWEKSVFLENSVNTFWLSCSNHMAHEDKRIIQWLSSNITGYLPHV